MHALCRLSGHSLTLLDASPDLLAIAADRVPAAETCCSDLCSFETQRRFGAVTCRGVLNDVIGDADREAAIATMASALAPGGVLILDVREADAAWARAVGAERIVETSTLDGRSVRFAARSRWSQGLLHVHEVHEVDAGIDCTRVENDFVMRPWATAEIRGRLDRAGMTAIEIEGGLEARRADRIFITAVLP